MDKYLLLRRHKIPEEMGETMAQVFTNMIPFFCLLYGISLYVFSNILAEKITTIGLAALLVTLAYLILPVRYYVNKCTSEVAKADEMTHEKYNKIFDTDYDRSNPMTEKMANLDFLEENKDDFEDEEYATKVNYFKTFGRFGGVMQYGKKAENIRESGNKRYEPLELITGSLVDQQMEYKSMRTHILDFDHLHNTINSKKNSQNPILKSQNTQKLFMKAKFNTRSSTYKINPPYQSSLKTVKEEEKSGNNLRRIQSESQEFDSSKE